MKFKKPRIAVVIGSVVSGGLCYVIQLFSNSDQPTFHLNWILISVFISIINYFIFSFLFKRFILNRLNLIVKNVYSTNDERASKLASKSSDDLLDDM